MTDQQDIDRFADESAAHDPCPHCGFIEVNRFGSCMCYFQVKQLDGTWKYMWEMERDKMRVIKEAEVISIGVVSDPLPGMEFVEADTLRQAHVDACKCGKYEPGVNGVCRWCHS